MRAKEWLITLITFSLLLPVTGYARLYGKTYCKLPGFDCKRIKGRQSWETLWPDDHDRSMVMRLNRMNVPLYPGLQIAYPKEMGEMNVMDLAPFPKQMQSMNEKIIVVDPLNLAWGAYDTDGKLIHWGPASLGADYCKDIDEACRTRPGSFRIYSLGSSDCISHKFPLPDGGAPMPYCMYFNNGQALHGEPNGLPGFNASHGCVRLYVNDAEWLRYYFAEAPNPGNDYRGTRVIVGSYQTPLFDGNTLKLPNSEPDDDDQDTGDDYA